MKSGSSALIAMVMAGAALTASRPVAALTIDATVLGTSNPWDSSLNPSYTIGQSGSTGPTIVTGGLDFSAGSTITVQYLSGMVKPVVVFPAGDGIGDGVHVSPTGDFPSTYTGGPYVLGALEGAFTTAAGVIVGNPFYVGNGGSFTTPVGATALQLGINDDIYRDNTGFLDVTVSGMAATTSPVPLPASLPLMGSALLGLAAAGYGLQRKRKAALAA